MSTAAARTPVVYLRSDDAPLHRSCRTQAAVAAEFVLPPLFRVPDHEHTPPHIVVILRGSLTDVDGSVLGSCVTGAMRYAPGGDHHRIRIPSEGTHCLVVEAGGFPELRLKERVYVDPADCADLVRSLERWLMHEPVASPARIEDCVLALFCRVRGVNSNRRAPAWISDVRSYLDAVGVTAAPLAEAARLVARSPTLMARAFRAEHAVSIHRYYRRRQIDRAWGMLADLAAPLAAIAHECGFADQSHMTRTFVRETGDSPSQLRSRMARGASANWFLASPLRSINISA